MGKPDGIIGRYVRGPVLTLDLRPVDPVMPESFAVFGDLKSVCVSHVLASFDIRAYPHFAGY
jgi:hypothetical protein